MDAVEPQQAGMPDMPYNDAQPIFAGDFPDPSVVQVGRSYVAVHSSFEWAPGLLVWRSDDLLSWTPVGHALAVYDGDVWAPEIVHHQGLFLIYYKSTAGNRVVTATDPAGPWSAPRNVGIGWIDPGHAVDAQGRRWLHVSDGYATALSDDGLRATGEPRRVIEPWPMPDWPMEGVCLEGPKLFQHGGHWHYLAAQGGTAGPATSHMVVHARGPTPMGPWTWSPLNPVVHTPHRDCIWWSTGHGTALTGPDGSSWMLLHGYRRGFYTLGRQTLLFPLRWSDDGWLRVDGPLPEPPPRPGLSDDFTAPTLHWQSWRGGAAPAVGGGLLRLPATGTDLASAAPLTINPGHAGYSIEVELDPLPEGCQAGLCLFYNPQAYHALAVDARGIVVFDRSPWRPTPTPLPAWSRLALRVVNDHHEVSCWYALDGGPWRRFGGTAELSGYHHNVFHGFLSLRAGIFACGTGTAAFHRFRYVPSTR